MGESSDQTKVDPSAFNCYEFFKWDELPADATDKDRLAHITLKAPKGGFAEGSLATVAPISLLQVVQLPNAPQKVTNIETHPAQK